ncbi:formylglycine-generating enzyme family protein [Geomesophilobacter sediminis]|uniref:SUMF1/EgtB/PvdO family nonheme iron enzyme n=1 Tax=Geomesophilobacter sediminis TaxID=2798584 RepID=A0A8J7J6C2_9BACT|nr:SUMF1/EgtB/PvdO family nonheme iron enzyme [Geomesophilobacter sediminis]MBJ6724301.1 SUMF1/EgtB/PvdO family nonheme iron enzyme [Geomesophilobacter sediminis]
MKRLLSGWLLRAAMFSLLLASAAAAATAPNDDLPEIPMVRVKGGCFRMGDAFGSGGADERPVHQVCLHDFYLGKYPVTQKEWVRVMGNNPSQFQGEETLPVENVSYDEVQKFIAALRKRTGKKWRLPTEAEWEYAARGAGKAQKYPGTSKDDELGQFAWLESNSGLTTHPVGEKRPNDLGIYDLAGNVWQWVQDRYDRDYYRQSPRNNPKGDPFGVNRVLKGGSAAKEAYHLRASYRDYQAPDVRGSLVGFRLALPAQ